MYDFILNLIFFGSLGIILFLLARALPRLTENGTESHPVGAFDRFVSRLPLKEVDARLNGYVEKFLRKAKVFILRFDNSLNERLERLRRTNGKSGEQTSDLFGTKKDDTKE